MKKSQNISAPDFNALLAKSKSLLGRNHIMIAFIVIFATMIYAVYSVNTLLSAPEDTTYRTEQEQKLNNIAGYNSQNDKKTIEQINNLQNRQESTSVPLPGGRINPFTH